MCQIYVSSVSSEANPWETYYSSYARMREGAGLAVYIPYLDDVPKEALRDSKSPYPSVGETYLRIFFGCYMEKLAKRRRMRRRPPWQNKGTLKTRGWKRQDKGEKEKDFATNNSSS
ncbi:hypothetical protein N3K66_000886 [Trichothecium roseum]|uniref:Uncharacterized protein n=1 Tax=Trichothecium roseum TaxID=47278 RepID=A0ACC0VEP4_9HYPO|nr:hypothetical protein N3K66_000886 [Trichothecium roseum]